jgi:hypothetical protein
MTHTLSAILITLVLAGALLPIAFAVMAHQANNCDAFAVEGHYEDVKFYNQVSHATDSPVINRFVGTDVLIEGIQDSSFDGKNVTSINMKISQFIESNPPTGNIIIGIFNDNQAGNYTLLQAFATIDISTVTVYNGLASGFDNYIANHSSGYIMQSGDIIGVRGENGFGKFGERSGLVTRQDDTVNDVSFFDLNDHSGPFIHGGAAVNGNFFGYVTESVFVEDTEEPQTGGTNGEGFQNQNFGGPVEDAHSSCLVTWSLFFIVTLIAIAIIMLLILVTAMRDRD